MTSDCSLWCSDGLSIPDATITPRSIKLNSGLSSSGSGSGSDDRIATAIEVVPPKYTRSQLVEVLVATSDRSVVVVDESGPEDQLCSDMIPSPIILMTLAPNGKFLAAFRKDGKCSVV